MPPTTVTYRRAELYEQVWTDPVTKVAKRYGISDVALRKMCKRLGVPTPWAGYWAQLAAGKQPRRPPLVPSGTTELTVTRREPEGEQLSPEFQALVDGERDPARRILVGDESARRDSGTNRRSHADQPATGGQRVRARRIMKTLAEALALRGVTVDAQVPALRYDEPHLLYGAVAEFHGDRVFYGIEEFGQNILRLIVVTRGSSYSRLEQRDTDKHRIESTLNRFLVQIYKVAHDVKKWRIIREQREREEEARREREYVERQARLEFETREKKLLRDVHGWRLAKDVRAYVLEALGVLEEAGLQVTKGGPLDDKYSWAMQYADRLDPVFELQGYVSEFAARREGTQAAPG